MSRLDPTTLPEYQRTNPHPWTPGESGVVRYYQDGPENLVVDWWWESVVEDEVASFILPLDILSEEQVLEILRRNGCPVPGGAE